MLIIAVCTLSIPFVRWSHTYSTDGNSIALKENKIYVVQASILGSILVNLLLVLGTALVASCVAGADMMYSTVEAQLLACLLFVSIFVVLIPVSHNMA